MTISPGDLRLITYAAEEADLHQSGEMDLHEEANATGKFPQNVKRNWKRLEEAGFARPNPLVVFDEARFELADHTRKLDQSDGVPADMIDPAPNQPRTIFNAEDRQELIGSISPKGLLKPLLTHHHPDLAGHYRAQVSYDRGSKMQGDHILTQLLMCEWLQEFRRFIDPVDRRPAV